MKKLLLILFLIVSGFTSFAQLDTIHYIPPMYGKNVTGCTPENQELYISTPSVTPVAYTVEDGAGNVLQTGTVSNAASVTYTMNGLGTDFSVLLSELNTAITDKGLIIKAADDVYANLRLIAGGNQSQAASLTSKGTAAFGNDFRIFGMPNQNAVSIRLNTVGIMAVDSNTTVNIDLTGSGAVLAGTGAPSTATVISVLLHAGESYVFALETQASPNNLSAFIGKQITSDKSIVVNMGAWAGSSSTAGGQDVAIDQATPANSIGTEYAIIKAGGNNSNEKAMIIGNTNGTEIYINGSTTPITTIGAGDFYTIDGSNYISNGLYIETSEPVYCWQLMAGSTANNTQGAIYVPPISCFSPTFVDLIPDIEKIGSAIYPGGLNILTEGGATVTINGAAIGVTPTSLTGSTYDFYQVTGLTGDVEVNSTSFAVVGVFGASGNAGFGGYYSGFGSKPAVTIAAGTCAPGIVVDGGTGFSNFQWLSDGAPIAGETNQGFQANIPGNYSVAVSNGGACVDTSAAVFIPACPTDVGISKEAQTVTEVSPDVFQITYAVTVENFGSVKMFNVQVTDTLTAPSCATVSVINAPSIVSGGAILSPGATNPAFNPGTDNRLLLGTDTLTNGATDTIKYTLQFDLSASGCAGAFDNQAFVSGADFGPNNGDGTGNYADDISISGPNPDPNGDDNPDESGVTSLCFPFISAGTGGSTSLCLPGSPINLFSLLTGSPDNTGSWSGPSTLTGGNLGTFDPATMTAGSYVYTVIGGGTCPNETATIVVTLNTAPNAGANGTISFCTNDAASNLFAQLTGTPDATGTWSGPSTLTGGNLGTFDPATMTAGTYTYTVAGAGNCSNATATVIVTLDTAPNAGINGTASLCTDDAATNLFAQLTGSPSATGTWSGPSTLTGGNLGTFDPSTMTAGTYTYTVTGSGACSNASTTVIVTLNTPVNAGANGTISLCTDNASIDLFAQLTGSPDATGTWSGPSTVTGGNLGTFDPTTMSGGTYTYTVTGTGACSNATATVIVTLNTAAFAGGNDTIAYCTTSAASDLFNVLTGSPDAGGTWSGTSTLGNGDQGTFDPATMIAGTYTYVVTAIGACSNDTADVVVIVDTAADAGTNATVFLCDSDTAVSIFNSLGGAPQNGGTWSGPSALLGGDTGVFNPMTMNVGTYTYTIAGSGACSNSSANVIVFVSATACDSDGDGIPDSVDLDDDNDGIPDTVEGIGDTDGDGIPDSLDLDSDNDGIPDIIEGGGVDVNGDGKVDELNPDGTLINDADGDGWADNEQLPNPPDTDGDGIDDFQDLDSDNDGIYDIIEDGGVDTDNDGKVDDWLDSDGDSIPDYADVDATGGTDANMDGIDDALQGGTDTDGDGIQDTSDQDADGDGWDDDDATNGSLDTDNDGISDYQDTDSDNDGIPDIIENGGTDADGDGMIDNFFDFDDDGADDNNMTDGSLDTDNDGTPDHQDTDSDNDGIPDVVEAGGTDTDGDGMIDNFTDVDGDGWDDNNPVTDPLDSDNDGVDDYIDLDSDNDGIPDVVEAGGTDVDGDGMLDNFTDADGDGWDDNDGVSDPLDTDNDGTPDYTDLDSDNDGIPDIIEAGGVDVDGDGILDNFNDADGDGMDDNDIISDPVDTDNDGNPDYTDLDSDGDGVPDVIEAGGTDVDGDGMLDNFTDTNGDGADDTNMTDGSQDTDGDGNPDYTDNDDDNDDVLTVNELDKDNNGTYDDCDNDGTPDYLDSDPCGIKLPDGFSPNGDGVNELYVITGLSAYPDHNFTIINRWGTKVFEASPYNNDWDGTNTFGVSIGEELPVGTYFYILDLGDGNVGEDGEQVQTGYIYLTK